MKTIAFYTLGCKVNQYDTEAMREAFERAGWAEAPPESEADAYLVNTCTVTGTGDQKSRKLIRRIAREHPEAKIIVAGCLAQREAESVLKMENVSLALGAQRRGEVVSLFERALLSGEKVSAVGPLQNASFESLFVTRHEGKTRATMKIQEGCDRYCAYCIIPTVRGPVRSMPLEAVRQEARRLAGAGYPEIVVTGIHLASYGRGTGDRLLEAIRAVHESARRVRLGSLEPTIVTEEFARALSELPGLQRQFHLSLQSGSPGVLRRMRRQYTPEEYFCALSRLRDVMPDCAITTDVLTGFPGESEEEARETLEFVEKCGFARLHVFPYSRRGGTLADRMPGQVPEEVKKIRAGELLALGNQMEENFVSKLVGTMQEVLFEESKGDFSEGYTGQYVRVRAKARPGEIRRVTIGRREGTVAYAAEEEGGEPYGLPFLQDSLGRDSGGQGL